MVIVPIHVNPTADLAALSPIQRFLFLLLLFSIKDRATSACLSYETARSQLTYTIDGENHSLEPLSELFAPFIGTELRSWINPRPLNRSLADSLRRIADRLDPEDRPTVLYRFMLIIDPIWSIWDVTVETEPDRGRATFSLRECTDWAHEQAKEIYRSLLSESLHDEARFHRMWRSPVR